MTIASTESAPAGSPNQVNGVLNYLADRDQHPVSYNFKPPPGVPARTGAYTKFTVPIHSARAIMSELSLDRQGFAVTRQNTAVANFYDPEEVRRVYYPEVERMVANLPAPSKCMSSTTMSARARWPNATRTAPRSRSRSRITTTRSSPARSACAI